MKIRRLPLLHADDYCLLIVDLGDRHGRHPIRESKLLLQESRCSFDVQARVQV